MYIDISKHAKNYITDLIEKRVVVLKKRILKEKVEDWYDYDTSQVEIKLCEASDEYYRLSVSLNDFYSAK